MKRTLTLGLATVCSLTIGVAATDAAISLANPSFEEPQLIGTYQTGFDGTSWQAVLTASNRGGIIPEDVGGFGTDPNAKAPDGRQWAFLSNNSYIYQHIGSLDAGQKLHVTFTQYMQLNSGTGSDLSIEIWNGDPTGNGIKLDSVTFLHLPKGQKAFREATLDPGGAVSDLYFVVRAVTGTGDSTNVSFDNFVLTAIPEPASLVLMGAGGLFLLRRRCGDYR